MAQWLSERLRQQFVIENRPGAATNIALQAAVNSKPDGYTLVSLTSTNASNATLYDSLSFNLQRDIIPVACLSRGALVLEVTPSFPTKSVAQVHRACQDQSGEGQRRVIWSWFDQPFGAGAVQADGWNYRNPCALSGDAPALTDAISGQVQATFSTVTASLEYVRTGKLRALGVTTAARWDTVARGADHRRFRARLRGEHMDWSWCAARDAARDRREAQSRNQCRPCRSKGPGAAGRSRQRPESVVIGRIREASRR